MDTGELDGWGVRVAQWAAPDETVIAGQITRAYATGGRARQDLFRTAGHAPGGLGGGIETVLPALLDALAYAADAMKAVLGTQHFGNVVSVTALLVSMRAQGSGSARQAASRSAADGGSGDPGRPEAAPDADGGNQAGGPRPEAAPSADTVRAALRLYERLRARSVETATAEELAAVLTVRFSASERPQEAAAFLDSLVADEPPAPVRGSARRHLPTLRGLTGLLHRLLARRGAPASRTSGATDDPDRA